MAELRADPRAADPRWQAMTDNLGRTFAELDLEGDGNKHAVALSDCLSIVARAKGAVEQKILLMLQLVNTKGAVVQIPRTSACAQTLCLQSAKSDSMRLDLSGTRICSTDQVQGSHGPLPRA